METATPFQEEECQTQKFLHLDAFVHQYLPNECSDHMSSESKLRIIAYAVHRYTELSDLTSTIFHLNTDILPMYGMFLSDRALFRIAFKHSVFDVCAATVLHRVLLNFGPTKEAGFYARELADLAGKGSEKIVLGEFTAIMRILFPGKEDRFFNRLFTVHFIMM